MNNKPSIGNMNKMKKANQPTAALGPQNRKLETRNCTRRTRRVAAALCLLAGALVLSLAAAHAATTYTWINASGGTWSTTGNWSGGLVGDGAENTASFSTLNITANRTVTLDSARTIGVIQFGDTSGAQNWTLSGANTLTMDRGASKPLVRALQNTATISVVLAGNNGFRGPDSASGTLVLNAANTYTGDTEIDRNILRFGVVNAIPSGVGFGNVVMLANVGNPGDTSKLDLNTLSPTINGLNSIYDPVAYPSYANAPYVYSTAGAGTSILTVGAADANGSFGGVIQNGTTRVLALTKIGAGTQTLTNANTYTGATTISGGTLQLSFGGSISSSTSIRLGPGGTFDVSGVSAPPYLITSVQTLNGTGATGTIAGDLSLDSSASLALAYVLGTPTINVSSGTLTLNGNATTVTITGSLLGDGNYKLISKSGGLVAGPVGSVTVGGSGIVGGGTPSLAITGDELYLNISGGATVVEWGSGDGTWAVGVSGWNSGGSATFANGNAALFADAYSTGNPTITLSTAVLPQSAIVTSTKSYTITGTGDIGGAAEVRMLGPGTLTLDVANAHTGGTTLSAGTLNVKKASALGAASGTFTINGGTLDNTSGSALTTPDYPQAWNGNFTFTGSSDLNLGAGAVTLGASRTVTVTANTLTVGGDVSGTGFGLTKAGTGTLALGGNNTFTGGVTINEGELIVNKAGALNSASPNIVTMPNDTASKILSLNGNSLTIANLTKNGSASAATAVVRNNHATTPVTLQVSVPSGSVTYGGTITDGGAAPLALTKIGTGNFTFGSGGAGSGTYSGDTTVYTGKLIPGANNIFPHGAGKGNMIIGSAGTLDMLDRQPITVNGLSGSGIVNSSDKGGLPGVSILNVGDGDASAGFSGVIENIPASGKTAGTITLVKIGSGTQTLSGANTYSGTTTVNGGTLLVNSPGSLPATAVTVNANATLGGSGTINGSVTVDVGGTISAGASAGTLTLANGLSLGVGATNVWELTANNIFNPGTDFDQIALTGGSLVLDGSSVLTIKFIGTATTPDLGNPFWQYPRQWQIIAGNPSAANFNLIDGTNGITAGTFTTTADGPGVTLVYTPSVTPPAPTPVTSMNLASGPGSDYTLTYSGGTGGQFVLVTSLNVEAPLNSWTPIATNIAFSGSFTIPAGVDTQGFYRVRTE
jgi:fibronectin-binding autotransporter adhesin